MKTEMKHTPTEWSVHRNLETAVSPNSGWEVWTEGKRQQRICTVLDCANAEGNVRLIAAAPELLEALQDVLRYCVTVKGMPDKDKGRTDEQQAAYDKARAAIAKAVNT